MLYVLGKRKKFCRSNKSLVEIDNLVKIKLLKSIESISKTDSPFVSVIHSMAKMVEEKAVNDCNTDDFLKDYSKLVFKFFDKMRDLKNNNS